MHGHMNVKKFFKNNEVNSIKIKYDFYTNLLHHLLFTCKLFSLFVSNNFGNIICFCVKTFYKMQWFPREI
jgi:hypothetical protein